MKTKEGMAGAFGLILKPMPTGSLGRSGAISGLEYENSQSHAVEQTGKQRGVAIKGPKK